MHESPKLLIINHYFGFPTETGGIRHFGLAKELKDLGWEVEIATASTEHRNGKQRSYDTISDHISDHAADKLYNLEFTFIKCPNYGHNSIFRIFNMLIFFLKMILIYKPNKLPDVVLGSTVHPLAALAGKLLAKRFNCAYVYEIRDLWPETLISFGQIRKNGTLAKALRTIEASCWKSAILIVSPLGGLSRYADRAGYSAKKILHLPNGVDATNFEWSDPPPIEPFQFVYLGAMSQANNIEALLGAAEILEASSDCPNFLIDIYGTGPTEAHIKELVILKGLKRVTLKGPVVANMKLEVLHKAHCCLMPLKFGLDLYGYGASPNKLQDYMAAGRPVLLNIDYPLSPVVDKVNGFIVQDESFQSWANAIRLICQKDVEEIAELGRKAANAIFPKFTFRSLGNELDQALREALVKFRTHNLK